MKQVKRKKSRLCKELFIVCVIAFCISGGFFLISSFLAKPIVENYIKNSNVVEKQQEEMAKRFQDFIQNNQIKITNLDAIESWVEKQSYLYLKLYYNDILVFDSISHLKGVIEDGYTMKSEMNTLNPYYEIEFGNESAFALFYCLTYEQMMNCVQIVLLIIAFLFYFLILAVCIHKKLKYVLKLQQEIYQLTKVNLAQPITILGRDEISDIANGIESMRKFALDKIEKEREVYRLNQELITSLSHDIRTPLTSLIGYLEILNNTKNSEQERKIYQTITLEKAYYIKKLTDSLFDYSYIQSHANEIKLERVNGNELVMQMVEETLLDLEMLGIKICREVHDINCNLMLNVEMINRVFENIFSNIKKYADLEQCVYISYKKENDFLVVSFRNMKKIGLNSSNGTHIGIKNCIDILKVHNGKLEVEETMKTYSITIYLPKI